MVAVTFATRWKKAVSHQKENMLFVDICELSAMKEQDFACDHIYTL